MGQKRPGISSHPFFTQPIAFSRLSLAAELHPPQSNLCARTHQKNQQPHKHQRDSQAKVRGHPAHTHQRQQVPTPMSLSLIASSNGRMQRRAYWDQQVKNTLLFAKKSF